MYKENGVAGEPVVPVVRYSHDCEICVFLGQFERYDLYYCSQVATGSPQKSESRKSWLPTTPTVVARYGDYGPDYMSGLNTEALALKVAKERAFKMGLIDISV